MYICLLIALLCPFALSAAALTLPQARATGLSEKQSLKASAQTIAAYEFNELREYSKLLPQLTVSHTSFLDKELSLDTTQHTLTLHGSQIIFDAAGPQFQAHIAKLHTEQATYHYKLECNELRHSVATQFLQTWLLQEKQTVIAALKKYTTILLCTAEREYTQGKSNSLEYLATKTTIADQCAAIAAHKYELKTAHSLLIHLMGKQHTKHPTLPRLSYSLTTQLPSLEPLSYYIHLAFQYRPELQEKKSTHNQYRLIARSHRLGYLPTISTHATLSKTFAGAQSKQGTNTSLGVSVQWNFFDGLQRVHAAHAADAHTLRTSFEQQDLKSVITHQITQLYNTLEISRHTLATTRARLQENILQLKNAEHMYTKHMLNALGLAKQRFNYCQASHAFRAHSIDLHTHWQTLAYYCGYPPQGVFHEL